MLFILALDIFAFVLLLKYFPVWSIFPAQNLALDSKHSSALITNVMNELAEHRVECDLPGTAVLTSKRHFLKAFPMVFGYIHTLIKGHYLLEKFSL